MTTPTQEALAALENLHARAINCIDALVERGVFGGKDAKKEADAYLATIRRALEESGKDAERYRWLRGMAQLGHDEEPEKGPYIKMWFPRVPKNLNGYIWAAPTGEKLDAAIDAARAAEGG